MTDPSEADGSPSRRSVLKAVGSTAIVSGLAGCSYISGLWSDADGGGGTPTSTPDGTPTPTETATETETPTQTETAQPAPDFEEDCLPLDPGEIEIVEDGDLWLIVQGERNLLSFDEFENAKTARDAIQHYGFTRHCFVGRPDPGMRYWTIDGTAATAADPLPGGSEDCLPVDPDEIEVVEDGDLWLIVQGERNLLSFDEFENAKTARDTIEHYGFTQNCFVGRPNPGMTYWLADGE